MSVLIRSNDLQSGDSDNSKIKGWEPIQPGLYKLVYARIPNSQYNVNSTNNVIYLTDSVAGAVTATIPQGFYVDGDSLATAIKTVIDTATSRTYTVAIGDETQKLTITPPSGTVNLTFATNTTNSARALMGFAISDTGAQSAVTSDFPVNLASQQSISVLLNRQSEIADFTDASTGATFLIPVSGYNNYTYFYEKGTWDQYVNFKQPIKVLDVRFEDHLGVALDFQGKDWEILLHKIC